MEKFGEGHVAAMGRLGLEELRGALYPESNVAQPSEYGLYGTLTPGEVAEARRESGYEMEPDAHSGGSILGERMRETAGREDVERDEPEPPMER